MKRFGSTLVLATLLLVATPSLSRATPWAAAGLSEEQAAAHLLDRFAFGARPGEVADLVEEGIGAWLDRQLTAPSLDPELEGRLAELDVLSMPLETLLATFPPPAKVRAELRRRGAIPDDLDETGEPSSRQRFEMRRAARAYFLEKGYRPQREMLEQLATAKLLRAVYAEGQLHEVLTDFWFNHFNVALADNATRSFVLAYERDAIRPFVLGRFGEMLTATAQHPAMLVYLDNARSFAEEGQRTTVSERSLRDRSSRRASRPTGFGRNLGDSPRGSGIRGGRRNRRGSFSRDERRPDRRMNGLNENYARELLELHTLGVDGGYTQEDVREVARAFTGWTTIPPDSRIAGRLDTFERVGAVQREGAFVFVAVRHDAERKTILGQRFAAGRGIEDGRDVLRLLGTHPSTARHLARKLAVRFVSDDPPTGLVDRLAERFLATDGDLALVLRTLVDSPEFWSAEARAAKVKSPFELTASALRALDAEVEDALPCLEWIARMGQPLYNFAAPTGYPDEADFWVSAGGLLHRMNFGLQLATGRVEGVDVDFSSLPEGNLTSSPRVLQQTLDALLPQRRNEGAQARLEGMVGNPELLARIEQSNPESALDPFDFLEGRSPFGLEGAPREPRRRRGDRRPGVFGAPTVQEQIVGLILGSPEFQRR